MKAKQGTVPQCLISGMLITALFGSGCASCPSNKAAGIPFITCQPENTQVHLGKTAHLHVKVKGISLSYRWLRNDEAIPCDENETAQTADLILPDFKPQMAGLYRCEIVSQARKGQVLTSTREAAVGFYSITGTNPPGSTQPPVSHNPVVSTTVATATCGKHCGWAAFNVDDSGQPYVCPIGATRATINISNVGTPVRTNCFFAMNDWWVKNKEYTSCSKMSGTNEFVEYFPATAGYQYTFTVYFRNTAGCCPKKGDLVDFRLIWE